MAQITEIIESIKGLRVTELVQLTEAMEKEFNVSAASFAMGPMPQAGAGAPAAAAADENATVTVMLTKFGENKVNVIKVVRTLTGLGLKEAKDLVEAAPSPIKEGLSKKEAEDIKKQLVEAGGEAEIK